KKIPGFNKEVYSIAKARIKNALELKIDQKFLFSEEDLRFCTNQIIAKYRAERLNQCNKGTTKVIIDLCCGIGIQAIEFAKLFKKVYAVDINPQKIKYAKINASIEEIENITFMQMDAVEALHNLKNEGIKANVVFWDPERAPEEKERGLESLRPGYVELISLASHISSSIVVELPPQIEKEKIFLDRNFPDGKELEYLSLNQKLNRLSLYLGPISSCIISAVCLPSKERIEIIDLKELDGEQKDLHLQNKPTTASNGKLNSSQTNKADDYLYEIDSAVTKAGLFSELVKQLNKQENNVFKNKNSVLGKEQGILKRKVSILEFGGKKYLTSNQELASGFLKGYHVLKSVEETECKNFLKEKGFGKVVLHGAIEEKEYFKKKTELEKGLSGEKTAHLFLYERLIIITKIENK
ncbi:methyltransferase domain-containing protein, partial [Candidatus Woesearchaeota archaeon]|nr:methyltransferase domain-containing protein [Candidatus Woesearchaeota archaeon]